MKALLKILYFLLALIVIILLVGIFLPKKSHIESGIFIKTSPEIVFDQINILKNWEQWSPWYTTDSTIKLAYGGPKSGTGALYSWTSQHSGSGTLTITASEPYRFIQVELDFGTRGKANTPFHFEKENEGTQVTWAFDNQNMGYFERYIIVLFKKSILSDFNKGLMQLKEISGALRLDHISEVKEVQLVQRYALAITDSALVQDMSIKMSEMYGKLISSLERRKLQSVGVPFAIWYKWNNEGFTTFACGIPIAEKTWNWNDISSVTMPEGKAIMVTHWGNYNSIKPYEALDMYLKENSLQMDGAPWEEYITDPKTEKDTSKWETRIYYPVR